jgi:hypothetical protein
MAISAYTVLVYLHLVFAFLLLGSSVTSRITLTAMRSASNAGDVLGAFKAFSIIPRVVGPAVVLTVLSGIALVWRGGFPWLFWMVGSIVLVVVLNIWQVVVILPPTRILRAAASQAAADPAAHGAALIAAARQPRLSVGHWGMELIGLLIIALMVFKPA